jgi:hypothetical protein
VFKYASGIAAIERQLTEFLTSIGISHSVTSRVRTCNQQYGLYATGQSQAAPTTSQHEFGFAFDIVPRGGYARYRANFPETVSYIVRAAEALGGFGIAERTHAHIQAYSSSAWHNFILARTIGNSIPIPSKRPTPPHSLTF